jgi:pimeloyl-ACP methyl ester carboxylesterase
MQRTEGFGFLPLTFDDRGQLESADELDALVEHAKASPPATDVIFLAHGFRNDVNDATGLYNNFIRTFGSHLRRPEFAEIAKRRFVAAGVYWPSKPFRETYTSETTGTRRIHDERELMADAEAQLEDLKREDATPRQRKKLDKAIRLLPKLEKSTTAQDEFVRLVLSVVDDSPSDETEGLPQLRSRSGSEVLARLAGPEEGTRGFGDWFGGVAGSVGKFLNLTKWYVMKDRSGVVGAVGVAGAVREFRKECPDVRIHLVGHSLGGRLMAACAKALGDEPLLQVDSLLLLEAAFSHFGFSADNGRGNAGFFRDVVVKQVVKGPFVSTFSAQDTVVGNAYAIMSRLAFDNTREIGDASDEFGGIGRNGPLRTTEVATSPLNQPGTEYAYQQGIINNLDGSGGLIKDHGDVTNDAVTYAFASAVAQTR